MPRRDRRQVFGDIRAWEVDDENGFCRWGEAAGRHVFQKRVETVPARVCSVDTYNIQYIQIYTEVCREVFGFNFTASVII